MKSSAKPPKEEDFCIFEAVEEKAFEKKLEHLKSKYPRIYEIKDSISWTLCRNPRLGAELGKPGYYVHETGPFDQDAPKFWVLYKADESAETVYLISIEPVPEQNNSKKS